MNSCSSNLCLYAITDRSWLNVETLSQQVEKALKGGATMLQLREKHLSKEAFIKEALVIKKLCRTYNVPLIINDNVDIALAIDADGVHVGQQDQAVNEVRKKLGPHKIVGVTAKNIEQARVAQQQGASYLGVGAVFETTTKLDTRKISLETLKTICETVNMPVVAIGGITQNNINELIGTGIHGVAVISAIFAQSDIEAATKSLKKQVEMILNQAI